MRVRRLEMYRRVRRPRLPLRSGWKEYKNGGPSAGSSCRPTCSSPTSCRSRSSPGNQGGDRRHDENVDFDRAAEIVGDRALMEELRRISIESTSVDPNTRPSAGSSSPTPSSSSADTPARDRSRRRGADARLLAFWPADRYHREAHSFLRQAVRARLGNRERLGQDPPAPKFRRVVEQTRPSTSSLRADHGAVLLVPGAGLDPPKRNPRPPGKASSGRCRARFEGSSTCGSAAWRAGARTRSGWASSARSCSPTADRGLRDRAARRRA